ncbi:MAG: PAS domain-containing protein [Armatimonadota bacterium]|nr:PAS domain-containing protein [Armatimonadota bacterium]
MNHSPLSLQPAQVAPGTTDQESEGSVQQRIAALTQANDALQATIVEHTQTEEALKRSEMQLAEAQQLARLGSWSWDRTTNTVTGSAVLSEIYGIAAQAFDSYEAFLQSVHPADREHVEEVIKNAWTKREPFHYYYRIIRPDGAVRLIFARGVVVADETGQPQRLYGTAQDITERRSIEEELANSREQLRALAARLESLQEEERTRIAREIHDELGQALTGLKMDLAWLARRLPPADEAPGEKAAATLAVPAAALHEQIKTMSQVIDHTIQSVRRICSELRPRLLDDLGLEAAIEWQTQDFQRRTAIRCKFVSDFPRSHFNALDLDQERATGVFRCLQEALTNVARHAHASRVHVTLQASAGQLVLKVQDNGRGFTATAATDEKTLGLIGMRERARLLGGETAITGRPGKGTTVTVKIPLRQPEIKMLRQK